MNIPILCPLKMLQRSALLAVSMAMSLAAQAQNVIESVSGALQGGEAPHQLLSATM